MGHRANSAAVFVLFCCGCAAVDLRAMAAVQIVNKVEPPPSCRALGLLEGKDSDRWSAGGMTYDAALTDLRRSAAAGGGNYVVVDKAISPREADQLPAFVIRGRLFACPIAVATPSAAGPAPSGSASAAPAPAPSVCEPDCSPGFTCLRGRCVSACNPLCSAGERCGQDRICHPISAEMAPSGAGP